MFTNHQADYLIQLPKKIINDNGLLDSITIEQKFPFNSRFLLGSEVDEEFTFLMEVQQSSKFNLKFDLHHQEDQSKVGLFRINYNGQHKNPEDLNDKVPDLLKPFKGQWFSFDDHHAHIYVEGYKPLAWAIPLTHDICPVKSISNINDIASAFLHFCERINLITNINIDESLL